MNSKILSVLEFDKILNLLAEQANASLTKERILKLTPLSNLQMVQEALTETTEAVSVILYKGSIPIGDFGDITDVLGMSKKGKTLTIADILKVKISLKITREVKTFLSADLPEDIKILHEITTLLEPTFDLEKDIDKCFISDSEIADSASPKLKEIRKNIKNTNALIKTRIQKMTQSESAKQHLQDSIVTMRNGRYVIPVKKEYISLYPGMVHDQSATGATVFVEPQSIVDLNNELKQLNIAEQSEILRILQLFTARIAEISHILKNNQNLLQELDYISAKGKLSIAMGASSPRINDNNYLSIKSGSHPLLDIDKVVPMSVELGEDWTTLLITGPNTGGKTVALKTIGILCLMTLSGLHIPADKNTDIPMLDDIFADIGDEQSIEQSLSTFSSHMKNIIEIFSKANIGTLVLLDELGAGTDPSEGAALGIAELEKLMSMGALVVATTHYTELKKYAIASKRVENASMEFDVETLSPTYKLRMGLPGKSNAFVISKKLGLREDIIERAEELLGDNKMQFEKAVSKAEDDKVKSEKELYDAKKAREKAQLELNEAKEELNKSKRKAQEIIELAKKQAREMLKDAQETIDDISTELRSIKDKQGTSNFNEGHIAGGVANSRRRIREAELGYEESNVSNETREDSIPKSLEVGDRVKYIVLDQSGEVETLPDSRGNLTIRIGPMKMNANIKDLILLKSHIDSSSSKASINHTSIRMDKAKNISPEINVIGKSLEEALVIVLKYIDDALLSGLKSVRIIHGHGEGILKNGIREELKNNSNVKSIKSADYNNGGDGCTVVEFK